MVERLGEVKEDLNRGAGPGESVADTLAPSSIENALPGRVVEGGAASGACALPRPRPVGQQPEKQPGQRAEEADGPKAARALRDEPDGKLLEVRPESAEDLGEAEEGGEGAHAVVGQEGEVPRGDAVRSRGTQREGPRRRPHRAGGERGADRDRARKSLARHAYLEVFVDAPVEICEGRDPKGLYAKARRGEIKEFTGISSPYERPEDPDVHIRTDQVPLAESVDRVLAAIDEVVRSDRPGGSDWEV